MISKVSSRRKNGSEEQLITMTSKRPKLSSTGRQLLPRVPSSSHPVERLTSEAQSVISDITVSSTSNTAVSSINSRSSLLEWEKVTLLYERGSSRNEPSAVSSNSSLLFGINKTAVPNSVNCSSSSSTMDLLLGKKITSLAARDTKTNTPLFNSAVDSTSRIPCGNRRMPVLVGAQSIPKIIDGNFNAKPLKKRLKSASSNIILVYPFVGGKRIEEAVSNLQHTLLLGESTLSNAELMSLQRQSLKGRSHVLTITVEDRDRLRDPQAFLNDTLVDFWMRW